MFSHLRFKKQTLKEFRKIKKYRFVLLITLILCDEFSSWKTEQKSNKTQKMVSINFKIEIRNCLLAVTFWVIQMWRNRKRRWCFWNQPVHISSKAKILWLDTSFFFFLTNFCHKKFKSWKKNTFYIVDTRSIDAGQTWSRAWRCDWKNM